MREIGDGAAKDVFPDKAFVVTAGPSILDAAVNEITVTAPDGTSLRADEGDDVAWIYRKGAPAKLAFLDRIDMFYRISQDNAIETIRRILADVDAFVL